jgi:hypothetical protein
MHIVLPSTHTQFNYLQNDPEVKAISKTSVGKQEDYYLTPLNYWGIVEVAIETEITAVGDPSQ